MGTISRSRWALVTLAAALTLAACGGGDGGSESGDGQGNALEVIGTDALAFQPEQLTASAGQVTFELTAEPSVKHTLAIEGVNSGEPIVEAEAGQTATGSASLDTGTYTFFCDVPGHREAGMEGTLEVTGS